MLEIILCSQSGQILHTQNIDVLKEALKDPSQKVWVDLEEPSSTELAILNDVFGFDANSIEEVIGFIGVPKIQIHDQYAFLILHRLFYNLETEVCDPREFEVFVSDRFIVTVHESNLSRTFKAARQGVIDHPKKTLAKGSCFVLVHLLQLTLKDYEPVMEQWEENLDDLERKVLEGSENEILDQILQFKKLVGTLKKNLIPEREILRQLYEKLGVSYLPVSSKPQFKNLVDEMNAFIQTLEALRDHASSVFDVYATMLTIKLNQNSHQLNFIMQRLTIATSIFLPLTFIVGLYGMNFQFMPELHWKWAYPILWILMLSLAIGMYLFFKKRKWL